MLQPLITTIFKVKSIYVWIWLSAISEFFFMSCNDDFKNMKIAWELHHEIKNSKNLIPWFSTFHYARRLQKSHLWSAWILLEYYIAHCTMMRFFKTFIVEHGKAKNLFMSSCTLFWDVILGWYHEILGRKFITFLMGKLRKHLFWTKKKQEVCLPNVVGMS